MIIAGLIGIFNRNMSMYHKIGLGNTRINIIIFNDDLKPTILGINDTNHLDKEAK